MKAYQYTTIAMAWMKKERKFYMKIERNKDHG